MVKNTLFVLVLLYAAYYDYKYRIIPDKVHVIIMLLGLIDISVVDSFLGLILVPLPVLAVGIIRGGIGGGDIKFIGSVSFFLGIEVGLYGSVLGLLIGIIISGIYNLISSVKVNEFPLAPYLALGYIMVLI
jgi:leader peptidase (prepilin peptidase)/N-methyltransferase